MTRRKKRRHYPIASGGEVGRTARLETVGLAPKTLVAAALPLIAGLVLLAVDKLAAGDTIDDTVWWTLIGSSPLIGGGAYAAPAAPTKTEQGR